MKKKVLIIQLHHLFGIHPLHHSLIQMLLREGCEIDVIFADYPESRFNLEYYQLNLHRVYFPNGKKLIPFIAAIAEVFKNLSILLFRNKFDCIIAIEPQALIAVSPFLLLKRNMKQSFVYYSLEILLKYELKKASWKVYKSIESWLSRRVDMVITQDKWRANLLAGENKLDLSRVKEFPNTVYGLAKYSKSLYLHGILNLEHNKKIVLCLGTAAFMSTYISDLVGSDFFGWPEDWVLVIHSGAGKNIRLETNKRDIIHYTNFALPFNELELLYCSADIGLALYREYDGPVGGENLDCVGHSSGKFNLFLKCGKPVITTNQYTFIAIREQNNCSVQIETFDELPNAIKIISSSYENFSSEAVKYYNNHLNVELYTENILKEII